MAELKMIFGFSDEFLEFAVKCSSQYDDTTRNMARELIEARKCIAEKESVIRGLEKENDDLRCLVSGIEKERHEG